MATRLLLTLLALLTGLVAQTTPAQARACELSGAQVGAVEVPDVVARSTAQGQQTSGPRARFSVPGAERGCRKPPRPPVFLPTIQFGPDRALE